MLGGRITASGRRREDSGLHRVRRPQQRKDEVRVLHPLPDDPELSAHGPVAAMSEAKVGLVSRPDHSFPPHGSCLFSGPQDLIFIKSDAHSHMIKILCFSTFLFFPRGHSLQYSAAPYLNTGVQWSLGSMAGATLCWR